MTRPTEDLPDSRESKELDSLPDSCGILKWISPTVELNLILELYLRELTGRLYRDIQSVFLHGSCALGDVAPAFGDIDLLVLVRRELGEAARGELKLIHRYLAASCFAPWGRMFDATYYVTGQLAAGGKMGRGIRGSSGKLSSTDTMQITPLELLSVLDHGRILFGDDPRKSIRRPRRRDLLNQMRDTLKAAADLEETSSVGEYVGCCTGLVNELCALDTGEVVSKTESVRWFAGLVGGKAADAAVEANRLRRGELKTGLGGLRPIWSHFVKAMEDELNRVERGTTAGRPES